jgi:hypothetical protein
MAAAGLAASVIAPTATGQERPPPFHVYVWLDHAFLEEGGKPDDLEALGVTGTNAEGPAGAARAALGRLPFYVDHAVPKGFLHLRREEFDEARLRWRREPTAANLKRPVCLRDPAALARAKEDLRRTIEACGSAHPVFLSPTDEPSATRGINPIDWCRCDACAAAFPGFLVGRWGSEALAREVWATRWRGAGGPAPVGTDEARRALFHGIGPLATIALWNDTRAFAEAALAEALTALRNEAVRLRPGLRIALLGASMPSAFGGFDWEELAPRFDVIEPYDWGATHDVVRSLAPRSDLVHTMVPRDRGAAELGHELWRYALRGDRGVILFDATDWTGRGRAESRPAPLPALAPDLLLVAGERLAPWRRAVPQRPQIAVLHSMPSTRLHWLLDTRHDGASWFNRLGSHEMLHASEAVNREAWAALLADLGFSYRFVTPRDLRDDTLLDDGTLALVVPRAIALSDAEAAAIARFAATRLVIADCQCGLFNHRLQKRDVPVLDDLFGISRRRAVGVDDFATDDGTRSFAEGFAPAEPGVSAAGAAPALVARGAPLVLVHRPGAGRTVYLNLRVGPYLRDRIERPLAAERLRAVLRPIFTASRVRPRFEVTQVDGGPPWPFAVHARKDGADHLVAIELAATTGARPIDWSGPVASARPRVRVAASGAFQVTDLLSGEGLGSCASVEVQVSASRPAILRLTP